MVLGVDWVALDMLKLKDWSRREFLVAASWVRWKSHGWGWRGTWGVEMIALMSFGRLNWWICSSLKDGMSSGRQWR